MITWPLDNTQYTAAAIGSYCACNTRGVFNQSGDFAVSCIGGFDLQVSKGLAWLKKSEYWGVSVLNEENEVLTAEIGHGQLSRTIAVTLRLDKAANSSYLTLKYSDFEGEAPVPVRDDFYDEIILAYVHQKAGAISFTTADITDTRLDENLCGVMRNALTGVDTQSIHDSAAELLDSLRQALVDVSHGAGVMVNEIYDPNENGIDVTNQQYTHTAPTTIIGQGINGYFKAKFTGFINSLTVNTQVYSIKNGINLKSEEIYTFIIDEEQSTLTFTNNSKMKTLLWENASPQSSFGQQNVQIDFEDYSYLEITHITDGAGMGLTAIIDLTSIDTASSWRLLYPSTVLSYRPLQIVNNAISFSQGYTVNTYGNSIVKSTSCVPLKIYGVRG